MTENKIIEPTIFTSNKLFIQQLISFKYIFLISIIFFISVAYIFNKNSTTEYEVYAVIRATKNETPSMLGSNELFRGIQSFQAYNDIEDGIINLRSFSMIISTLDKLNFEVGYFSEKTGFFKSKSELYQNTPFKVIIHKSYVQPINSKFYIDILSDSTFRIYADRSDAMLFSYIDNEVIEEDFSIKHDQVYRFNENIDLDYLNISITKNNEFQPDDSDGEYKYYFELYNLEQLTKEYLKNINTSRTPSSSIMNISLRGENLEKSITLLNWYLNFYFEDNLARKNTIAINTINFIDSQISGISDSLDISESNLERFRKDNQVMNLSYQGQLSVDNLQQIETEQNDLQTQQRYYIYILEYFRTTQDLAGIIPPSAMNVDNPLVNQLIVDLLNLNSDRSNIISQRGEKNLFLAEIENRISLQKQNIIDIVSSNLNTLKQTLSELNYRAEKLKKGISALPKRELNMASMQRRFKIDDAIYTYLLQKRSEATITMASNYPDYEMLEPAREITSYQVAPKILFNYLVALIMGIGFPVAIMILKNLINFKISNTEYIHQMINRPPIATIFSNPKKSENILIDNPVSFLSESFRTLRSNIFQKHPTLNSKVILITSPQPQDGKSFLSFNLAISIALVGKKVLIIDADLKHPVLHDKFKLENKNGVSNFMAGTVSIEDILINTTIENLSFLSAGPNLPNATEIVESGGLDALIEAAKERFEYIILDTSPVGFMADTLFMTRYADHILLVVRSKSTLKELFTETITNFNSNNINNYDVVFNDKSIKESPHGLYSNYYIKGRRIRKGWLV